MLTLAKTSLFSRSLSLEASKVVVEWMVAYGFRYTKEMNITMVRGLAKRSAIGYLWLRHFGRIPVVVIEAVPSTTSEWLGNKPGSETGLSAALLMMVCSQQISRNSE
ncbi:hypothetical protein ANCCAN_06718 [Ancylostoma caninum]|uniref:Uncharacterized protein n=1 Tax=Ancylostoma caninum TaxID=29170 RepID=A0A368GSC5_ANCCA|nr:hypothetical protein ANCCAN_06718 [Ancylostoma caninum]